MVKCKSCRVPLCAADCIVYNFATAVKARSYNFYHLMGRCEMSADTACFSVDRAHQVQIVNEM